MRKIGLVALLAVFIIGSNCGTGPEPVDYLAVGWERFEAGDLDSARTSFNSAINENPSEADAHNGLGWCDLLEDNLTNAYNNFSSALVYDNLLDANAGAAIASTELARYTEAIDFADLVLNANPSYVFSHYTSVDARMLRLSKAKSFAALGDFSDALEEIQEIEGSFDADPATPEGQAEILAKIEELISGS